MENRPVWIRGDACGRTDRHDEAMVAFLDCANAFFNERISKFGILQSAAYFCTIICIPLSDTFGQVWEMEVC